MPKRHRVGTGKACWCGVIHYTNPQKTDRGTFKCAVCRGEKPTADEAEKCAIADHKARLKRETERKESDF
jgi:hypothetical protein